MKIKDLLSPRAIRLNAPAESKSQAIDALVELHAAAGNLTDPSAYKAAILAREGQGTTAIGEGIAVPHAKSDSVAHAALAAMTVPGGVDYDAPDGKPSSLLFMIAAPPDGDVHLEILSRLMVMLMEPEFCDRLRGAKTAEEFIEIIDAQERAKYPEETPEDTVVTAQAAPKGYRILAVTACPTGIAHTYMAAEALEKAGAAMNCPLKAETNGSGGAKNVLTRREIADCDGIIIAADKNVEMDRFDGKPVLQTTVSAGINKPQELIQKVLDGKAPIYHAEGGAAPAGDDDEKESFGHKVYKHLMNGVSHMLPFVIGGGILIALAFLFDMGNAGTAQFGTGTPLSAFLKNVGGLAFSMMMPILAGYIAASIGERPALMPGIVGGFLATTGGSGFFGALFAGFIAGYLIILLKKIFSHLPQALEGTKPILIYPVLGLVLIGLIMTYIINPPTSVFNHWLADTLSSMTTSSRIILGLVLGGMMSIDFGGPINKAAYVFGTASLMDASGAAVSSGIMASVMIGGMVPPIAISLSMLLFKKKFTPKERQSTITNFIMGLSFITEGAIPFAASDPLHIIPPCAIGSAAAGALSMLFGCTVPAPHGGIFVFGVVTNWPMYFASLAAGAVIAAVIMGIIRKKCPQS